MTFELTREAEERRLAETPYRDAARLRAIVAS